MFEYRSTCYTKALRLQALYVPRSSGPLQGFLYAGPDQWTTIFGDKMRDESPFICKCDIPHGTVKTTTYAILVPHCSALVVAGNPKNRRHRALESSQMRRPIMINSELGGWDVTLQRAWLQPTIHPKAPHIPAVLSSLRNIFLDRRAPLTSKKTFLQNSFLIPINSSLSH